MKKERWDAKQQKSAALTVMAFKTTLSDITLCPCSSRGASIKPRRKDNIGTEREDVMTMAGLKKTRQAEWRPFSSSAETRPKKSQAQWTQANEGLHCLQPALTLTQYTIHSTIVLLFCILLCFHWCRAHNTIYFSYARWLDVGLCRQKKQSGICHPVCFAQKSCLVSVL